MAVLSVYAASKFKGILLFGVVMLLSHEKLIRSERAGSIAIHDNPLVGWGWCAIMWLLVGRTGLDG